MQLAFSPLKLWSGASALSHGHGHGSFLGDGLPTTGIMTFLETMTTTTIATTANNNDITSSSALDILWSPETVLSPLNAASEPWVRSLVWLDFKLAVSFFVVAPLMLLCWAVVARIPQNQNNNAIVDNSITSSSSVYPPPIAETVLRYMTSYWQASSLLLLTLALDIQEQTICVLVGLLAQAMIVVSLWWWSDLNDELLLLQDDVSDSNASIGNAFILWRNVATFAASTGVIIQVPFQTCIGASSLLESSWCAPWLEPPKFASGLIGVSASPTLELLTLSGCALYAIVVLYYVVVLVPSVGRSGRAARPNAMNVASPIGAWQMMGFLEDQSSNENNE